MNCRALLRFTWRSIRLFDCVGVPVQFHTTTLIWPCGFICWLGWIDFGTRGLIRSALFLGVLYGSLLVHEFAHVLTARRFGCRTKRVLLLPIGCVAELEAIPQEPWEMWVTLAGPAASLALAALASLCLTVLGPHPVTSILLARAILKTALTLNVMIGLFNLLPCFPMDGGRVLRSLLAVFIGLASPRHASRAFLIATRIAVRYVARSIALGMIALTVFQTHFWMHIFLFVFLIVAGECEYFVLRELSQSQPAFLNLGSSRLARTELNPNDVRGSQVTPWAPPQRAPV